MTGRRSGVTLIELVVTIAMLGFLAGVVGFVFHGSSRVAEHTDIESLRMRAVREGRVIRDDRHGIFFPDGRTVIRSDAGVPLSSDLDSVPESGPASGEGRR